jgi:kumamolisin
MSTKGRFHLSLALVAVIGLLAAAATTGRSGVAVAARASSATAFTREGTFHRVSTTQQFFSAYTPDQLATAYDFAPLYDKSIDGTGQKVALIELDRLRTPALQQFDETFNLPNPTITQYYVGGKKFTLQNDAETNLDVEWLHALAPGAAIQIYYMKEQQAGVAGWQSMATALRTAAANGATTISISLGTCGPSKGYKATSTELASLVQSGVTVFVASGDNGDQPGPTRDCGPKTGVSYPASDPSVIAVGGTSLELNSDNTIASETAWDLSGGGVAKRFLRPAWQAAPGMPSDTYRWAPDVSFVADPDTGVSVYFHGNWYSIGGTSVGAPAWAAAWSLVRESLQQAGKTVGAAQTVIYKVANSSSYATAFHQITDGTNGKYVAGPGWNAVTGLGTPDVANLVTAAESLAG